MRTTVDLPDDLLKQAKILAVQRGCTLRDMLAAGLRAELARTDVATRQGQALPTIAPTADASVLQMQPAEPAVTARQALAGLPPPMLTAEQAAAWLTDSRAGFDEAVRNPWA